MKASRISKIKNLNLSTEPIYCLPSSYENNLLMSSKSPFGFTNISLNKCFSEVAGEKKKSNEKRVSPPYSFISTLESMNSSANVNS